MIHEYAPEGPPTTIREAEELFCVFLLKHKENTFIAFRNYLHELFHACNFESVVLLCQVWKDFLNKFFERGSQKDMCWKLIAGAYESRSLKRLYRHKQREVVLRDIVSLARSEALSRNAGIGLKMEACMIFAQAAAEETIFGIQERKDFVEKAFATMESLTIEERKRHKNVVDEITNSYVQFYLAMNGSSPRLEKLLRKAFKKNEEMFGIDNIITIQSAHYLSAYLNQTYQWKEAIELNKRILSECDFLETMHLPKLDFIMNLMEVFWKQGNFNQAESMCKKALKLAKQAKLKEEIVDLKKDLKRIRKKKKAPLEKVKEAKMSKKEYRKMQNFSESRACAYCGKNDGKLSNCGGCESVCYCSRAHQKADWQNHKKLCKQK